MSQLPPAFPLCWPKDWARSIGREPARFKTGFATALERVCHSLRLYEAADYVITTNLPRRRNGLPYATGSPGVDDPGVAVYWIHSNDLHSTPVQRVIACDRWTLPAANLQAIHLSLEALRGLARWGASELVARAFVGFKALPTQTTPSNQYETAFAACASAVEAKTLYRRLMREHHPDVGGDLEQARAVTAAYQAHWSNP